MNRRVLTPRLIAAVLGVITLAVLPTHAHGQGAAFAPASYTTTLTPADVPVGLAGPWGLTVDSDGRFATKHDGEPVVEGSYTLQADRITFTDERGPLACQGPTRGSGTYSWALAAGHLTLVVVEDACPGRAAVLSSHPWTRQD
jgi:hypothetical protein